MEQLNAKVQAAANPRIKPEARDRHRSGEAQTAAPATKLLICDKALVSDKAMAGHELPE